MGPTLTPHKHSAPSCQKTGRSQRGLRCDYAKWKFLHAGESSQLGGEWDGAHPSSSVHPEEEAKLLFFVVKNGHDSRGHSLSLS